MAERSPSLLFDYTNRRRRYDNQLSKAILASWNGDVPSLLEKVKNVTVLSGIFLQATITQFRSIDRETILALLFDNRETLRQAVVLRIVYIRSKKYCSELLEEYIGTDAKIRYYNVVHWLDFGIAVEPSLVRNAVNHKVVELQS